MDRSDLLEGVGSEVVATSRLETHLLTGGGRPHRAHHRRPRPQRVRRPRDARRRPLGRLQAGRGSRWLGRRHGAALAPELRFLVDRGNYRASGQEHRGGAIRRLYLAVPLTFASSAFVQTDGMPGWLQAFADRQPITQVVDAVRGFLLDQPVGPHGWQPFAWCVGILLVFVPLSVLLYRRVAAR